MGERFEDQNLRLSDFQTDVWVVCPNCSKKANAKVDYKENKAKLICLNCGLNKEKATDHLQMAAHGYFDSELWYVTSFKNEVLWAYNYEHLTYLESYISAHLREHKNRSHFTLLEKLPKFYHVAKNREALLKLIEKLKKKD
jgi:transcription elongation factor Elf1